MTSRRSFFDLPWIVRLFFILAACMPAPLLVMAKSNPDPDYQMKVGMGVILVAPIFLLSLSAGCLYLLRVKDFWLHAFWLAALTGLVVMGLAVLICVQLGIW